MCYLETLVIGAIAVVLVVGGLLTYVATRAAKRTRAATMWAFVVGLALITAGTVGTNLCLLLGPALSQSVQVAVSALSALGFLVLGYSVYRR